VYVEARWHDGEVELPSPRDSVLPVDLPPPLVTELDIRAIEQRGTELPAARFRRGYRVAQVDAFLRQAVASLRSRLAENEGLRAGVAPGNLWYREAWARAPRSAKEVETQMFELVRSGYRMQDVDDLLDEVTYQLTQLEAESEALRARSASG
jgi:DivIVA domain-containing protein